MENFAITITLLLIGMVLRRMPAFPEQTGNVLNLFVIYVSLPALVLLKIPELVFSADLSPPLTAALVGIGIALSFVTLPVLSQVLVCLVKLSLVGQS